MPAALSRYPEKMKTIFISVFQPFIARNILNTGVLDTLLQSDCRVVLFVPAKKFDFYRSEYQTERVVVEPFDPEAHMGRIEKFFQDLAWLLINSNVKRFQEKKRYEQHKNPLRYYYHRFVIACLSPFKLVHTVFRFSDTHFNDSDIFAAYFDTYHPDVVFAPDVFGHADVLLMKSARRHGVRLIGMVRSWDNPTAKHLLRIVPDVLLVHNEIIRDELIALHDVSPSIIRIVGTAHYEYYRTYTPISRDEFFKQIGIDPKKRLMMFAPAGDKFISTDWQTAEILKRAYAAGKIPDDVITLIRIHPSNPTELVGFTPDDHFVIEKPGRKFEGTKERDKELGIPELHHLLDSLHYSELVINVVSSMVLDASVLDRPVVTVGFDGWEKNVPFGNSVGRYLADENMAKLLAIGGTPIVRDPEELIKWINTYLEHPEEDRDGRKKIIDIQCMGLDGHAAERIAAAVLS
jgi:hypothetical protein